MTEQLLDALKNELKANGINDFEVIQGSRRKKLCWQFEGRRMVRSVPNTVNDSRTGRNIIAEIRRSMGARKNKTDNATSRIHSSGYKNVHRRLISSPPEKFTILPDPMQPLMKLKEKMTQSPQGSLAIDPPTKVRTEPNLPIPLARERQWLEEMLKRGEKERVVIMKRKVTPGMAVAMLELNIANLPLVENQVEQHIERLKRGDFILTHTGISFAKNRVLNDGQHRLTAIARSGITGDLMVTFGAERIEFKVIDSGRVRRPRDFVGAVLKDSATWRTTVARMLLMAESGSGKIDPQLVTERALAMQDDERLKIGLHLAFAMKRVGNGSSVCAAYWWIATHSPNRKRVNEFFEHLPSGDSLTGVKLRLREWLRDRTPNKISGGRNGGESYRRMMGIVLAWNAWIDGKRSVILDPKDQGMKFPMVK